MSIKQEVNDLKTNTNKNFNLALIFTIIILFVYCYFGSASFFETTFASLKDVQYYKVIYHNVMSFVLFFGLGLIFVRFVMKQKLSEMGLKLKNKKFALKIILLSLIVLPLLALSTTLDKNMANTYPLIDFAVYGKWYQILGYYVSYLMYYIGWEFLFRGLLFFATKQKIFYMLYF